jgi:hypothetical protein
MKFNLPRLPYRADVVPDVAEFARIHFLWTNASLMPAP